MLASLLGIAAVGQACACESTGTDFSLGARVLDTALTEYAANGNAIVHEHGRLPGAAVQLFVECDRWTFGLETSSNHGNTGYAGQTSFGAPLSTVSRIADKVTTGSLYWRATDSIKVGTELVYRNTVREIIDTASVAGYPEQYDRTLVRIGSHWNTANALGAWTLAGSVSLYGEQSMRLTLPGKDSTTLTFSQPRQWAMAIQWRTDFTPQWFLTASYQYVVTEIEQSPQHIVTSNGYPVGVAYQPKSTVVDRPFTLSVGMRF
ncbi:MAG: hypothetical protein QE265_10510 [Rhodoferax sp.]|nr:hypothetical protein [Rhodoferax sp.]